MAEDFDKVMRQQQDTRAKAKAGSYDDTGHSATVTGPRPESLHLYQPSSLRPSSLITSPTDSSQATTSMARPLGRTQTLAHIEITESSNNIPVPDASGVVAPSSSVLQHRENSDVDDQNHNKGSGTRIDDGEDDAIQTTVGSQHISMVEPLSVQQSASSATRASTFSPLASTAMTNTHRFPSPASTVPEDPDPEYIFNQLAKHHIKIHDFAQYPPYTTVASLPSPFTDGVSTPALRNESTPNTVHPTSVPTILFTSETFDPRKALGEFELRLRQTPRTLPIPGKIIRRLIEIGWVTENEVESRCSESDLKGLEDFDARNRMRLLKLTALREQRQKQLGTATPTSGPIIPAVSDSKDLKPGTGLPINEGYTYTGAYPYVTLRSESVPKFAERDELVQALRPHFNITDRVIRMGLAMERERERDRQEAEDALIKVRREEEAERKRVECEVLALNADKDEEMSNSDALTTDPTVAEIASISPQAVNARKRSPHDAWADEENYPEDSNDESEVKRSRLARLQSETWYEQRRQQQQSPSGRFRDSQPHPHPQSQRKGITASSESHNTSNLQSQSQLRNQNQTPLFTPPEIQYPAPLSTYDPNLYPDAANAIEAQSQQSESQGRRHPHSYRPGSDTPLASDDEGDDEKGKKGITAGRGFGLTEDGEPDMNRPNALKRSPKKGMNRELTRGRTLVQIC